MANPLTLLMPLLPGTVPMTILKLLDKSQPITDAALSSIGTVHYARFTLLDRSVANLQPNPETLAAPSNTMVLGVITEYDGDFDAYINDFVAQIGKLFDVLLSFVEGGDALIPVKENVAAFQNFVTQNDASQHFPNKKLYEAYPQTVQQILATFPPQS